MSCSKKTLDGITRIDATDVDFNGDVEVDNLTVNNDATVGNDVSVGNDLTVTNDTQIDGILKVDEIRPTGAGPLVIDRNTTLFTPGTNVEFHIGDSNPPLPTVDCLVHVEGRDDVLIITSAGEDGTGESCIEQQCETREVAFSTCISDTVEDVVMEASTLNTHAKNDIIFKVGGQYASVPALDDKAVPVGGTEALKVIGSTQDVEILNKLIFTPNQITIGNALTTNTSASSVCIGTSAVASTQLNVALGFAASSTADSCISIGRSSSAAGFQSISIGRLANTGNTSSTAIGTSASATTINSIAIGTSAAATSNNSICIGNVSAAGTVGSASVAIGNGSSAQNNNAIALGTSAAANGPGAVAIGNSASATANNAWSIGNNVTNPVSNTAAVFGSGMNIVFGLSMYKGITNDVWTSLNGPFVSSAGFYTQDAVSYTMTADECVNGFLRNTYNSGTSTVTFPSRTTIASFLENTVSGTPSGGSSTRHSSWKTTFINTTLQTITLATGTSQTALGTSFSAGIGANECVVFESYLTGTAYITVRTSSQAI